MYVNFFNKLNFKKCVIKLQSEVFILNIVVLTLHRITLTGNSCISNHCCGPVATERFAYML